MTAVEKIVDSLRDRDCRPRQSGGSWSARCPAHEDSSPSLSVRGIEGQALVHCHAGCAPEAVLGSLGLALADLYDDRRGAAYRYDDGRVVHRSPDKRFRQSGQTDRAPTLYRRDAVTAAVRAGKTVYVVEGEKDVHALESVGLVATTAPMGAANWEKVDVSPLYGATVVAVVDRDSAGQAWAVSVRESLTGRASVTFVRAAAGKDFADHLAAGHGVEELQPVELYGGRRLTLTVAASVRTERQRWLWADRVPLNALCLLAGREGLGKSTIAVELAAQVTRGDLDGELLGQPRDVLIVATEDNRSTTIVPRLIAARADLDRVHFVEVEDDGITGCPVFPLDTARLGEAARTRSAALVILDAATSVIDGRLDGDRDRQMRQALEPLGRVAAEVGCSVLGIVHFGKRADADTGKLILGSIAWSQVARAVVAVAKDEESGNLLVQPTKHNLAPADTRSIAARIVAATVDTDSGPTSVGRVEWLGEVDDDASDHLGQREGDADDAGHRDEAVEWLRGYLLAHAREAGAGDICKAGKADGYAEHVLKRAKRRIGVTTHRISVDGQGAGKWVWRLPDEEEDGETKGGAEPSLQPQGNAREPREHALARESPCSLAVPLHSGPRRCLGCGKPFPADVPVDVVAHADPYCLDRVPASAAAS